MREASLRWGTAVAAAVLMVLYFGNTFVYLTPPNPVKARLLPLIMGLQHPLFRTGISLPLIPFARTSSWRGDAGPAATSRRGVT